MLQFADYPPIPVPSRNAGSPFSGLTFGFNALDHMQTVPIKSTITTSWFYVLEYEQREGNARITNN